MDPSRLTEHVIHSDDGTALQLYFIRAPELSGTRKRKRLTILFLHENAGNLSHRLPNVVALIAKLGCHVVLPSYRGYGKSAGTPSQEGLLLDAEAALRFARAQPEVDPRAIIVFGRSLGGAVAITLASRHQDEICALVLENTFTSIRSMMQRVFPALAPFAALVTSPWASEHRIRTIRIPTMFLVGEKDELVPPSMMRSLHTASVASHKEIHSFAEGAHMDTWQSLGYWVPWLQFKERVRSEDNLFQDE